jgi:hypothetical protein
LCFLGHDDPTRGTRVSKKEKRERKKKMKTKRERKNEK